jgi:hypothetical protein
MPAKIAAHSEAPAPTEGEAFEVVNDAVRFAKGSAPLALIKLSAYVRFQGLCPWRSPQRARSLETKAVTSADTLIDPLDLKGPRL